MSFGDAGEGHEQETGSEKHPGGGFGGFRDGERDGGGEGKGGPLAAGGSDIDQEPVDAVGQEVGGWEAVEPGSGHDSMQDRGLARDGGEELAIEVEIGGTGDEDPEEGVVRRRTGEEENMFEGGLRGWTIHADPLSGRRRASPCRWIDQDGAPLRGVGRQDGIAVNREEKGGGRRKGQDGPQKRGAGDQAPCGTGKMGHGNTSTDSVPAGRKGSQGETKNEKVR